MKETITQEVGNLIKEFEDYKCDNYAFIRKFNMILDKYSSKDIMPPKNWTVS